MLKSKDRPAPNPSYFGPEQMGQQSHMSLTSISLPCSHTPLQSSPLREFVTAEDAGSQLSCTAQYLSDLRHTRPARPSGARPPPSSKFASKRAETNIAEAQPANDDRSILPTSNSMPIMPTQKLAHRRTDSDLSRKSAFSATGPFAGRPLIREPSKSPELTSVEPQEKLVHRTPSMSYMENGTRWMEKQETRSLRQALEDMDLSEERRIHAAAQDEAAELVWKHRNPDAGNNPKVFANPDLQKDYRSHLRKGSYQRSHSHDTTTTGSRSASDGSQKSSSENSMCDRQPSLHRQTRKVSPPTGEVNVEKRRTSKTYDRLAEAVASDIAIAHRRSSSGSKRILSGEKKMYMDPNDKIWEDPEEEEPTPKKEHAVQELKEPAPVSQSMPIHVRKNPFARVRAQYEKMERSNSAPTLQTLPSAPNPEYERVEIQRNAPSQTRNPWYISNEPLPPSPPKATSRSGDEVAPKTTPTKEGKEVRGDDIRAATSKTRQDYSPNLPRPTVVSDRPGRPIVSFQKDWKPKQILLEEQQADALPRVEPQWPTRTKSTTLPTVPSKMPSTSGSMDGDKAKVQPSMPVISIPEESSIPIIVLPGQPLASGCIATPMAPTINVEAPSITVSGSGDGNSTARTKAAQRALPSSRPLARHAATEPIQAAKSTPHYTPSVHRSGALCAHCALPIAGRILSAAGERFHPGCFACHQCNTNLECVAFYPEPDKHRHERLSRIRTRRDGGEVLENVSAEDMAEQEAQDGDEALRFYCHLDFHELFSPRCKSCKTPIEGEVIVACGAEWHIGHFFCAQCGDPFDSTMPFVEKDGYAWCVGCHTNRYSSKCRKCKKPVTDVVVKALGSDWHGDCFVCTECNSPFDDGRYFLRGDSQDPVCVKCEERRLKA